MADILRVDVVARYGAPVRDAIGNGSLPAAGARTRNVDVSEVALLGAYIPMIHAVRIDIGSGHVAPRIDARLEGISGARRVKQGEISVPAADEAVGNVRRINGASGSRS